ncbi:MAG: trigger factor [Lachnospiraceae bacterium]|nr:trigger factor [Lachnospiraceae bacterium]
MKNKVFLSKTVAAVLSITMVMGMAGCGKSDKTSKSVEDNVTLGDYKNLEVDLTVTTITDEDVEEEIQSQLEQNSTTEEVTDRTTVQDADMVNITMTATVNGEDFEDGNVEDYDYTIGENEYGEEFDKGLIGKNKGDEFELTVTLPDDYADESFVGQQAVFKITLNKIVKEVIPEFNDEFVKTISEDYQTAEDYRKYIKEDLQSTADDDNESSAKEDLMAQAVENAEITGTSDDLYNLYYNQMTNDYTSYAEQWGMTLENFLASFMGMDEESFKDYVLDQVYDIQVAIAIAKAEDLEVSDDEYKKNLSKYAEDYGWDSEEELEEAYTKDYLKNNMTRDKVLTFLYENAKINEVPESELEDEDETEGTTEGSEEETTSSAE